MADEWRGEPNVSARRLTVCREVVWNAGDRLAPYTLRGVIYGFHPRAGFPFAHPRPLYLYAEFFGDAGGYDVWFDLVRLVPDDDGNIVDEEDEASFGPFVLELVPDEFVQGRAYVLRRVGFRQPGLYEFRLKVGGVGEPLAVERLYLEG